MSYCTTPSKRMIRNSLHANWLSTPSGGGHGRQVYSRNTCGPEHHHTTWGVVQSKIPPSCCQLVKPEGEQRAMIHQLHPRLDCVMTRGNESRTK